MQNQRSKFSIPKNVTYLNCAYMSPMMKSVERAGIKGMQRKRNPFLDIPAPVFFQDGDVLRKEFASVINADSERIVIIPSVSYAIANITANLKLGPGDRVVVVAEEFPSNYYPWLRLTSEAQAHLEIVAQPDTIESRGKKWNERILESINTKTKVVAISQVHWADGTLFDLEQIGKRAREVGAFLIIDGTQSVGAFPFDLKKVKADAVVCAGYKWLMGPYAIGMAYYGEHFNNGKPIEESWLNRQNSEDFAGLVRYQNNYQPGLRRYEVGEHSNFILVPMMIEALRQINRWKPEQIQNHCRKITKSAIHDLRSAGFWIEDEGARGSHLFGVRFPGGRDPGEVKEKVRKKNIAVSFRGNSLRIAPHVYNDENDLERLVRMLVD